jgi:hypothetical protein
VHHYHFITPYNLIFLLRSLSLSLSRCFSHQLIRIITKRIITKFLLVAKTTTYEVDIQHLKRMKI